tara:strand:- start:828 stop:1331 length:504 start_codon:yes stop_codon:yes gene_type:complete
MNVFAIESPCDDAFYGFQSFAICSSFDIVSEKLTNICKTTIKYNYFPEKKHKLGLILRDKDTDFDTKKNIMCCYQPGICNIREFIVDKNEYDDDLMNDVFMCFQFDNDMKLIYKDVNGIYSPGNKCFSTLKKTDDNNFLLEFVDEEEEEEKTVLLKLNEETNMLHVI